MDIDPPHGLFNRMMVGSDIYATYGVGDLVAKELLHLGSR
jgi:hypothetical protein